MRFSRALALVLLAVLFQTAWADQVVPSDRVESRLRVRLDANSTSTVVGYLYPGQAARLDQSVSYWYQVTLSDGTSGYVSKSWVQVVPDPVSGAQYLRLGGWNVKKLGHGSSTNFALVAQVIESHFDIVAIVEVMQKGGAHPGYDSLLAQLGARWRGMVTTSPRPNTSAGDAEFYAIVYRDQSVQPCTGWTGLRYLDDNDGSSTGTGPDVFSREPAFGCFAARLASGSTGFDFMLAAYHARWAGGNTQEIGEEVRHVTRAFQAMAQARPGENDRIIVGDFNLVTSRLEQVLGLQIPVLGTASTLNSSGNLSSNLYDHILIHDTTATRELVDIPEILDVRDVAADPRTFYRTVSDHLPIRARFRSDVDDD